MKVCDSESSAGAIRLDTVRSILKCTLLFCIPDGIDHTEPQAAHDAGSGEVQHLIHLRNKCTNAALDIDGSE